ncbi:MAM and LDL-receptor class A domain-containing protein 1-like isoform X2 [Dreissena polymorpha]|nr:MAM and LDL-receptor class A domain-containing protein 1-like isoform X2 [Dreissena polymorpha]
MSGVQSDHTCKNSQGQYMYIAGQDAMAPGEVAIIESPILTLTNEDSLYFWYTMNGFGTGSLSVIRVEAKENATEVLWSKSGHQNSEWLRGNVTLKPGVFTLEFKATVRLPIASDIAIDDVYLQTETQRFKYDNRTYCSVQTTTTAQAHPTTVPATTVTVQTSARTTTVPPSCTDKFKDAVTLPGSCDYENGTCGMTVTPNTTAPNVRWLRTSGSHGSAKDKNNYILGDHTLVWNGTASGFYMGFQECGWFCFLNPYYSTQMETVPVYTSPICLSFWYILPGPGSNLEVLVREFTGVLHSVWSQRNTSDHGWRLASLSITADPPYTVVFQTMNQPLKISVGIDDVIMEASNITLEYYKDIAASMVSLGNRTSPASVTLPITMTTEYPITTTDLPTEKVFCDFDEEREFCNWKGHNASSTSFTWNLRRGKSEDRISGAKYDHTCLNEQGSYMYIAGRDAIASGEVASIESPILTLKREDNLFFWYTMNGFGTGNLSLIRVEADDNATTVLWSKSGHQSRDWLQGHVTLTPGTFTLEFQATVRLPVASDIALDDVYLESEYQIFTKSNRTYCTYVTTTTPTTVTTTTTLATTRSSKTTKVLAGTTRSQSICRDKVRDIVTLPGSCDFENGRCGMTVTANESVKTVTWLRKANHGSKQYLDGFISGDHTHERENATGFYMDFQACGVFCVFKPLYSTRMETVPVYTSPICLSFWYILSGPGSNLEVFVREFTGALHSVWSQRNTSDHGWRLASMSITADPPYTIVFQTVNQQNSISVGVDDIVIHASNISIEYYKMLAGYASSSSTIATTTTINRTSQVTSGSSQPTVFTDVSRAFTTVTEIPVTGEISSSSSTFETTANWVPSTSSQTMPKETKSTLATTKKPVPTTKSEDNKLGKSDEQRSEQKSTVQLVGYSVGGLVGLVAIVVLIYFILKMRTKLTGSIPADLPLDTLEKNTPIVQVYSNLAYVGTNGHAFNGDVSREKSWSGKSNGRVDMIEDLQNISSKTPYSTRL